VALCGWASSIAFFNYAEKVIFELHQRIQHIVLKIFDTIEYASGDITQDAFPEIFDNLLSFALQIRQRAEELPFEDVRAFCRKLSVAPMSPPWCGGNR
jgi:hypothetical protein